MAECWVNTFPCSSLFPKCHLEVQAANPAPHAREAITSVLTDLSHALTLRHTYGLWQATHALMQEGTYTHIHSLILSISQLPAHTFFFFSPFCLSFALPLSHTHTLFLCFCSSLSVRVGSSGRSQTCSNSASVVMSFFVCHCLCAVEGESSHSVPDDDLIDFLFLSVM